MTFGELWTLTRFKGYSGMRSASRGANAAFRLNVSPVVSPAFRVRCAKTNSRVAEEMWAALQRARAAWLIRNHTASFGFTMARPLQADLRSGVAACVGRRIPMRRRTHKGGSQPSESTLRCYKSNAVLRSGRKRYFDGA